MLVPTLEAKCNLHHQTPLQQEPRTAVCGLVGIQRPPHHVVRLTGHKGRPDDRAVWVRHYR